MATVRRDITGITLSVATIGALAFSSFLTLRPFLGAAIWATMIVVSTWPLMLRLERLFGGRRTPAVIVMSLASLLVLVVPLTFAVNAIVEQAAPVSEWLQNLATNGLPAAPDWFAKVPLVSDRLISGWNAFASHDITKQLEPYAATAFREVMHAIGGVGGTLLNFLLTVAIGAVMYAKGDTAVEGIRAFCTRLAGHRGPLIVTLSGQSIRGVALGIVVTSLIQAALVGIGVVIAGVPYAAVIMLLVFMACVLQIGSIPIALGCGIYLFANDRTGAAIALVAWTIAAGAMNGAIRPFLIKKGGADMSILTILGGVIGGVIAFGVLGIFIGPLVLAVTYTLLESWVTKDGEEAA